MLVKPLLHTHGRDEHQQKENGTGADNNWFEMRFVSLHMFEVREVYKDGRQQFMHTNKLKWESRVC